MAEEHQQDTGSVEVKDRGLFDFMGKKEEKPQEEVLVTQVDNLHVSEPHQVKKEEVEEEKKPSLFEKLKRSDSRSSSSSSDEEVEEGGEKKKKKKIKDKIKGKISGEKEEDTSIPIEKYEEIPHEAQVVQVNPEEKKGFLEKIKDKLPGTHKKPEEVAHEAPVESAPVDTGIHEVEAKEKKGILEKIKEKLPGYHPKAEEEKKEKESDSLE